MAASQARMTFASSQLRAFAPADTGAAHLVGICGAGMKALAELLVGMGWRVTGSDLQEPGPSLAVLERRGVRIHRGHSAAHIPAELDCLIYSPAVSPENPERRAAAERGLAQYSYSQMLGQLMRDRKGVCIAGTHGKSTTTAMTACILRDAGYSPSAVFGAELCETSRSGWAGDGEWFVVESCEYQRSFLDLSPTFAALLSVEPDHFDCFQSPEEMGQAFAEFARRLPADGALLVNADCPAAVAAARDIAAEVTTFSRNPSGDWWASDVRGTAEGSRFRVFHRGEFLTEISLRLAGAHNVQNALAAIALSHRVGVSPLAIRESLAEFAGIRRRLESCGTWRGLSLFDDYAHHPTAVRATLQAVRARSGKRRIWCLFQPHQVSRTRALMDEFAGSFEDADEVLIAPVFAAREGLSAEPMLASSDLAVRVNGRGPRARFLPTLDRILATVEDEARPGDVLITMGAGDINRVHHEFARQLRRHRPAG